MTVLPNDLILDILTRLKGKHLGRCKCVSKPWRSMIRSRLFAEAYRKRNRGLILHCISRDEEANKYRVSFFHCPLRRPEEPQGEFTPLCEFDLALKGSFLTQLANGLLCVGETDEVSKELGLTLRNICTGEKMRLPDPLFVADTDSTYHLVYDPVIRAFKLLRLLFGGLEKVLQGAHVLTIRPRGLLSIWRELDCNAAGISIEGLDPADNAADIGIEGLDPADNAADIGIEGLDPADNAAGIGIEGLDPADNAADIGIEGLDHNGADIGIEGLDHNVADIGIEGLDHNVADIGFEGLDHNVADIGIEGLDPAHNDIRSKELLSEARMCSDDGMVCWFYTYLLCYDAHMERFQSVDYYDILERWQHVSPNILGVTRSNDRVAVWVSSPKEDPKNVVYCYVTEDGEGSRHVVKLSDDFKETGWFVLASPFSNGHTVLVMSKEPAGENQPRRVYSYNHGNNEEVFVVGKFPDEALGLHYGSPYHDCEDVWPEYGQLSCLSESNNLRLPLDDILGD